MAQSGKVSGSQLPPERSQARPPRLTSFSPKQNTGIVTDPTNRFTASNKWLRSSCYDVAIAMHVNVTESRGAWTFGSFVKQGSGPRCRVTALRLKVERYIESKKKRFNSSFAGY